MKEIRQVRVNGVLEDVPHNVVNLEKWIEYREKWIEYCNSTSRKVTMSSGREISLPNPQIRKYCKTDKISKKEEEALVLKNKEVAGQVARLNLFKRSCYTKDGSVTLHVNKYFKEHETYILELFGRFLNVKQVHKRLLDEGYNVPYDKLLTFYKKEKEKIRELRNKASEEYDDISLGIKRTRLETLDYLLFDLRQIYDSQPPQNKLNFSKEIRGIIEQARKEVEGDELKLTINGRIDINATIDVAMKNSTLLQNLTIAQMVISRVAARTGIPYGRIVSRLANSFYSKFNGFSVNQDLSQDPIYPSSFNYDIFDLKDRVEEINRVQDIEYQEVEEKSSESILKNRLLELTKKS